MIVGLAEQHQACCPAHIMVGHDEHQGVALLSSMYVLQQESQQRRGAV